MINLIYVFLKNRKLSTLHNLGSFFGIIAFYITPSRRKVVEKNCTAIGIEPNKKIIKKIYKNVFKSFMEFFFVENIDESFIINNVKCEDDEKIFKLIKKHNAIICAGAHLGAWEFYTPLLSKYFKTKTSTIGRRIKNKKVNELVKRVRSVNGNKYLIHKGAINKAIELLSEGFSLGVLLDHSATSESAIYVDFFGYKTSFIAGIPLVAVRKNIPLLPIFIIRNNQNYEIVHYPPIYPDKKLKTKERVVKLAEELNRVYEDIISKYPEQWFMLHKRFKRTENENGEVENGFYR